MTPILFYHADQIELGQALIRQLGFAEGLLEHRRFPDNETYLRICSPVSGRRVYLLCSLNDPDAKTNFVFFFSRTVKELGAARVDLIAPYLGYMRQDKRFHEGEAVTSTHYAQLISSVVDGLMTIDPHLHRHKSMQEIYTIPATVLHAMPLLASWIKANIQNPFLVGPDEESEQWVSALAKIITAPYECLKKERMGDREVRITVPDALALANRHPVLVDDIVSTAHTMITAVRQIRMNAPVSQTFPVTCLCVHPLFSGTAYADLMALPQVRVVSANAVPHASNAMDVAGLLAAAIK